ncbi:MAG: M28 family peptidase [Candidatus Rokubacteria bacterium]|nr:M28 family peptidase [Candidatus Rokubacteria bacterium]
MTPAHGARRLTALALGLVVLGATGALAAAGFDGGRAFRDVARLVGFGPRPPGSPALDRARAYIAGELRRAGWRVREHAFTAQTPRGPLRMVNVVAEWPGRRPEVVAVAGHYDTKPFADFRFVGANDGGSSAGLLLELSRALAARHRTAPPRFTRWLVFFDGEEAQAQWSPTDSLYGSRALVAALRASGELARLRVLIVADMIGDRDLGIRRESASTPWLADLVWTVARRLGYARHFLDGWQPVEDDHSPFLDAGVAATLLIDFEYGGGLGQNAYWHTAEDTLDKLDARSLQVVGEVILEALPGIDAELERRTP